MQSTTEGCKLQRLYSIWLPTLLILCFTRLLSQVTFRAISFVHFFPLLIEASIVVIRNDQFVNIFDTLQIIKQTVE